MSLYYIPKAPVTCYRGHLSTCWVSLINSALARSGPSPALLQLQSPAWSLVHRHQINVCWMVGPLSVASRAFLRRSNLQAVSADWFNYVTLDRTSLACSVSLVHLHSLCHSAVCYSVSMTLFSHPQAWACLTWGRRQEGWCSQRSAPGISPSCPHLAKPPQHPPPNCIPSSGRLSASWAPALAQIQKPAGVLSI